MSSDDQTQRDDPAARRPTCRCGFDRTHHFVSPKLDYSLIGWFWVFVGVNAMPKRVRFVCRQCGETLETHTDKKTLEAHRMGGT